MENYWNKLTIPVLLKILFSAARPGPESPPGVPAAAAAAATAAAPAAPAAASLSQPSPWRSVLLNRLGAFRRTRMQTKYKLN